MSSEQTTGSMMPHCDWCGRFHSAIPGSSWAMIYSGWPPVPDHEISRCIRCTEAHGPLEGQSGIRSECAAGIVGERSEPLDPDRVREDRDERRRMEREFPYAE